jgi:hypothetical protein
MNALTNQNVASADEHLERSGALQRLFVRTLNPLDLP